MNFWQGVLSSLCIVGLVAAGAWHADDPEGVRSALSSMECAGTSSAPETPFSVICVNWSADGRTLLSLSRGDCGSSELSVSLHDTVQKVNWMPIEGCGQSISRAALAPDGLRMLVATYDGRLLWIDLQSVDQVAQFRLPAADYATATAIADDGRQIAAGASSGTIHLFGPPGNSTITLTSARGSSIGHLSFSNDGQRLLSSQNNGWISLWDLKTGTLLQEFEGHAGPVTSALILPGNTRIISAGLDDTIRIWNAASGDEQWHGEFGQDGVRGLAVSPDGMTAAWGGQNGKIIVWDLEHGQKKFEVKSPASIVYHLQFSPDGSSLAVAGKEGTIRLYDARQGIEQPGIDVRQFVESVKSVNERHRASELSLSPPGA